MTTAVHTFDDDADAMLERLGLDRPILAEACLHGLGQYLTATAHHPSSAPGSFLYFETVRWLRDLLCVRGWDAVEDGLALTYHDERKVALAVSSGTAYTGNPNATPWFRYDRGPLTYLAIASNATQLGLFDASPIFADLAKEPPRMRVDFRPYQTWCLLHFVDVAKRELRAELSLPVGASDLDQTDPWQHRIILDAIPFDEQPTVTDPIDGPRGSEIDIVIRRKA